MANRSRVCWVCHVSGNNEFKQNYGRVGVAYNISCIYIKDGTHLEAKISN